MFNPLVPILIFLLTAGVKELFDKVFGKPVPSEMSAVIAAFVGFLVVFANMLGAYIPAEYLPFVAQVVTAIVAVFAAFGVHATVKYFSKKE